MIMGLDRTYHAYQLFVVFFFFYSVYFPCGRLSWLGYPSAFYCMLSTQYHIISYRIVSYYWTCSNKISSSIVLEYMYRQYSITLQHSVALPFRRAVTTDHCRVWSWVAYNNLNKKLSCRRETARNFLSLNILLSHSRSFEVTLLRRLCVSPY